MRYIYLRTLTDWQMILFSGGMAEAGEFLLDAIRAAFQRRRWTVLGDHVSPSLLSQCTRLLTLYVSQPQILTVTVSYGDRHSLLEESAHT